MPVSQHGDSDSGHWATELRREQLKICVNTSQTTVKIKIKKSEIFIRIWPLGIILQVLFLINISFSLFQMNAHPIVASVASMMDPKRQPLPKKQFQQSIREEGRRASSFSRTTWDQWRYRHLPHRVHGLQIAKFEATFIFCQNWKVKVKILQRLWGIWWQPVLWLLERQNPGKNILIFLPLNSYLF